MNEGPTLDWSKVKFHEPVAEEDWPLLAPEARLVAAIEVQLTGNVPPDQDDDC